MNNLILYVAKIVESTSTDGVGLRNSLYVSGCSIHCSGCHNKELWQLQSGQEMTIEEVYEALNIDDFNISILGGEPLMQYPAILELCRRIKEGTNKTIWLWTGYEIAKVKTIFGSLLNYVDVIVDGPFKEELRDTSLFFRGSKNQRIYEITRNPELRITDISDMHM